MDAAFAERAAELRERLDAPEPTTWRPDDPGEGHGALLIGELLAVQEGHTSWGARQIAILRDAGGQLWNVWLLHSVLVNEFHRQQPKLGEMVAIRYEGRVEPAHGSAYEKYSVIVDRPGGQVAWRDAGGAHEPTPEPAPAGPPPFPAADPEPTPAPAAETTETALCPSCGFANGRHADGCPEDIPF